MTASNFTSGSPTDKFHGYFNLKGIVHTEIDMWMMPFYSYGKSRFKSDSIVDSLSVTLFGWINLFNGHSDTAEFEIYETHSRSLPNPFKMPRNFRY